MGEWRYITTHSFLTWPLNWTGGQPCTLPTLRLGNELPGHIQQEAGCSPKPVLMSAEQFKYMISLCVVFVRHLAHLAEQCTGNHGGWGVTVLLNSITCR